MSDRYRIFRRKSGVFYLFDKESGKQESLKTKDKKVAKKILHAKHEANLQPSLNIRLADVYASASDPSYAERTWKNVMDEMGRFKQGPTLTRWKTAVKSKAFDIIRNLKLVNTTAEHFLRVLKEGNISDNIFLRRIQNFALDMGWIQRAIIPRKLTPLSLVFSKLGSLF